MHRYLVKLGFIILLSSTTTIINAAENALTAPPTKPQVMPNSDPHFNPKPDSKPSKKQNSQLNTRSKKEENPKKREKCRSSSPWKVTIAPYLWGINLNGNVGLGRKSISIHEKFNNILEDFKGGGMLWIDVSKGNWSIFLNSLYAYLTRVYSYDSAQLKPVFQFGIITAGASYQIVNKTYCNCRTLSVAPYIGARYTLNDAKINILQTTIQYGNNQNWTDPIIGARLNYGFNKRWSTILAADVGGTGNRQKSYNLNGYIGYAPPNKCTNITLYAGYRYLYQKYINNDNAVSPYIWKMHLFGPVLGIAFTL